MQLVAVVTPVSHKVNMAALRDKVSGSLLGLAVCDAVGTTVEFMPPGSFEPVTEMTGGGKFSLQPGQWTDDTSMALCLAESLIECQGFNPIDQNKIYWNWYQEGHLSSNGDCFDVGKTVNMALHKFQRSKETDPYPGSTAKSAAGNGSLMRLCPVPLLYRMHPEVAMRVSGQSSRTTHGTEAAVDACRYFGGLIVGALNGVSKEELLSPCYSPVPGYWDMNPLVEEVRDVALGSFKTKAPPDIRASGYVVKSLEAVLWAFHHTTSFEEGCLKVVNLGDDADTVGAIYGQLAGAYYGLKAIPQRWLEKCSLRALLQLFADELYTLGETVAMPTEEFPKLATEKCSSEYQQVKLLGYNLLETGNKEITRKLKPCPKAYKKLEDFDKEVQELKDKYNSLPPSAQNKEILSDFCALWTQARGTLELRLGRGVL